MKQYYKHKLITFAFYFKSNIYVYVFVLYLILDMLIIHHIKNVLLFNRQDRVSESRHFSYFIFSLFLKSSFPSISRSFNYLYLYECVSYFIFS